MNYKSRLLLETAACYLFFLLSVNTVKTSRRLNSMKKRIISLLIVCILVLSGCGKNRYPDLPKDAIAFKTGEEMGIVYNKREYVCFGTIGKTMKNSEVDKCIGYIIQDENNSSVPDENDKDTRVYTLKSDDNNNFLMVYYVGTTLMNQPEFYRAIDTKGENISIPEYIEDLEYEWWK